ncbi:MAG: alpha-N-acetylglucosaminidase [Muribaculaceae bacterium]|nr:alpha-N-acetylglucosaminidase [Muribaculaceae bacterium]
MKKLLITLFAISLAISCYAGVNTAIDAFLSRILPADAGRVHYTLHASGTDTVAVSSDGASIHITAGTPTALGAGLNIYLRDKLGITLGWGNMSATLPAELPLCATESHSAAVPVRYYFNFCTHSYSTPFWGEERWLQEVDMMLLHGINAPLMVLGFECVWERMLGSYGYDALQSFLPGPAYFAWFYMNNLTGWGGPLPAQWCDNRRELARSIFGTMRDLGIHPVVPGFSGMMPRDFLSGVEAAAVANWTDGDILPTGQWCSFERPAIIADTCRLAEAAARYYAAVDELYGDVLDTPYYAIDPFHEGGTVPAGFDCRASVATMWSALQKHRPDAVWVAQHWQENPREFVTTTIPAGRLLILDLHSDSRASTACGGNSTDASGAKHNWVYGMLNNYGGNSGLFGRAPAMMQSLAKALELRDSTALCGVGAIPEGIENNPMLFDLLFDLPWRSTIPSLEQWLYDYSAARYGLAAGSEAHRVSARVWKALAHSIYNCPSERQQGTTESVLLMRPSPKPGPVSTWALSSWYWDSDSLLDAVTDFAGIADICGSNANYRADLTDFVRQCVADRAHALLSKYSDADSDGRRRIADSFMHLISLQERLTATRPDMDLGRWIADARACVEADDAKDLLERNARTLLTTWGQRTQADTGQLHDYANREWAGLLSHYYAPRWQYFFDNEGAADGTDWFGLFEWPFASCTSPAAGAITPAPAADSASVLRTALDTLRELSTLKCGEKTASSSR